MRRFGPEEDNIASSRHHEGQRQRLERTTRVPTGAGTGYEAGNLEQERPGGEDSERVSDPPGAYRGSPAVGGNQAAQHLTGGADTRRKQRRREPGRHKCDEIVEGAQVHLEFGKQPENPNAGEGPGDPGHGHARAWQPRQVPLETAGQIRQK